MAKKSNSKQIKKLQKDVKMLKQVSERKFHYYNAGATTSTTIPTGTSMSIISLCRMAEGDTSSTRIAREILAQRMKMKYSLIASGSATVPTHARVMLMKATNSQGVLPDYADFFSNAEVESFQDTDSRNNYKILYDRTHTIGARTITGTSTEARPYESGVFEVNKKLNHKIYYVGSGSLEANLESGGLYLALICDQATNQPVIKWNSQLEFRG